MRQQDLYSQVTAAAAAEDAQKKKVIKINCLIIGSRVTPDLLDYTRTHMHTR